MKIIITENLMTDLDISNGARREIVDMILHPDEPPIPNAPIVKLKYLPAYLLVRLERTRASRLDGLDTGVIPIEVSTTKYRIQIDKSMTKTVLRKQYPLAAAYAYTDYKAQGQTMPCVIIDIATPPIGSINLFNLSMLHYLEVQAETQYA